MRSALDACCESKPRIMSTHDAPSSLLVRGGKMEISNFQSSCTSNFLQALLKE